MKALSLVRAKEPRESGKGRCLCYDFLLGIFSPFWWTNPGGESFMRMSWLLCVLVTTLAWGQAMPGGPPTAQPGAPAAPDTSASVPANAAVITIEGVCPPAAKAATAKGAAADAAKPATKTSPAKMSGAGCKTVITKAEFEKLANNLAPNITPQMKKQLAGVLPRLIAMSA